MKQAYWLVLLPLLAVQCHKDEPAPPTTFASPELRALARFRPGTYWVYRDSATAVLDSVWVTKLDSTLTEINKVDRYRTELITTTVLSSQAATAFSYLITNSCGGDTGNHPLCGAVVRSRVGSDPFGDAPRRADVLLHPLPAGQPVTQGLSGSILYLYRYPAPLTLGGRAYADVIRATNLYDESEGRATVTYYWAPGFGLVRQRLRRIPGGPHQTWTLVRQRIVQ
ncbi:hypothetical protein [Hymenobacter koreensis]|uniref:Lipoprotein n=1 Tax=Hymenobacter koreensis TaxID=1084523 RepID=A0ABP8JLN3_9BACT